MHDTTQCANCGRAIDDGAQKFCPACGQPTPAHRIDWHFLGHELEHSVLHMDRGVLYSDDELRKLLSGHLCRCTGYENIFKAVKKTMLRRLGKLDDPFLNT